jgi:hypothetical protein
MPSPPPCEKICLYKREYNDDNEVVTVPTLPVNNLVLRFFFNPTLLRF